MNFTTFKKVFLVYKLVCVIVIIPAFTLLWRVGDLGIHKFVWFVFLAFHTDQVFWYQRTVFVCMQGRRTLKVGLKKI